MQPDDLERLIDDRLRRLPPPQAPSALAPRIMRSVEDWATRPWYTRAWMTWPIGWRVASVVAAAAMLAALVVFIPSFYETSASVTSSAMDSVARRATPATRRVDVVVTAVVVVWRALIAPVVPYALGVVMVMFLACGLAGTALSYLVFGKAANR
jgi:anti-sigma factor RsiW